ncbi:2OG-Fe(II) oxygenase [Novosphingobium sp.]|uniref:prolyl hydroxylase family protein n=1 Tax=Novosphingobium sp. TaxID=1874826 RepID=UPI00260ABEA5|nr:2OG-Fe(II) oxygenase [Novosphingobium sp.]
MPLLRRSSRTDPDSAALAHAGERVRARLDADPSAYRLPVDTIEIYGVADFFSADECARLIAMVDAVARPSPTYHNNTDKGRTSYSGDVDPSDPFIRMLERRIDDLMGIDPRHGEVIQGQRYEPGQEFRAHFDFFNTSADYWKTEQARGGQRTWTAMGYLSAVEAGGATEFPRAPISVPPQPGALLVWNNMGRDGKPNPLTMHAGMPVERGVKYVVTKWYRLRPWC